MHKIFPFLLVVLLYWGEGSATALPDIAYLQQLQTQAAQLQLSRTRAWHALIHYEQDTLGQGVHSTVATPWFFRADAGRTNPEAELQATLAAFFNEQEISPRKEAARCLYPARYAFLERHLGFQTDRMPQSKCEQYQRWLEGLAPESLSLIFPSAYLNSPASMFGHTLLRVDSERQARSTELLAYALNFAANTDEENGIAFAYKGMTGGYPGVYGVFPYYEKVKQYAWIESRDVWSYRINFSDAEIHRVLAHLWEMRGVAFDYYFLTKNCSYQLLSLLQSARPSLRLVEQFNWYAIPADTIRALRNVPGLLGEAKFRPALRTELEHQADALTPEQREIALAVSTGALTPQSDELLALPERERARVLEVAHDLIYYRFQTGEDVRDDALPRSRAVLLARSGIPQSSSFAPVPVPDTPPDEGHSTLRSSAAAVWEDDEFSIGLRIRPAYHDVLDPPGGYTSGGQINFLDLGLRLDPGRGQIKIEDLTLIDIVSLSPRSDLFKPVSWQVATGFRRRPASAIFAEEQHNLGYFVDGGPGLAWGDLDTVAAYSFALASADANTGFDNSYAVGAGASAGILARPLAHWTLRAELGALDYISGDDGRRRWAFIEQQIPLAGRFALRLRAEYEDAAGEEIGRGVVTLHAYY